MSDQQRMEINEIAENSGIFWADNSTRVRVGVDEAEWFPVSHGLGRVVRYHHV